MAHVDVGVAEFCERWELESRLFPSKIGGKPAWLSLEGLPSITEDLMCEGCKQQLVFFLQVYAPFEEDEANFHRTLFIFICRNGGCKGPNNVKVFRSNLPRSNKFYSYEPPIEQPDPTFSLNNFLSLCEMCGCLGNKRCSKCKKSVYCSREHQVYDWKERHKHLCQNDNKITNSDLTPPQSSWLFTEMNIIIDEEEVEEEKNAENKDKEEKIEDQLKIFEKLKIEGKTGTLDDDDEATVKELEEHAVGDLDKTFTKFKERISSCPDQIMRYSRGGEPLWIAANPKIKLEDVPPCEYCKSPRQFELQIMPQILSILQENTIDFGIILIYTCKKSCTKNKPYKNEFVFKQDVSNESILDI